MTILTLPHLERFITLLHKVEQVERLNHHPDKTAPIRTGEHTFELAMMCWYIAQCEGLNLNHELILKYALAHDLVEAYAGDTPAFDPKAALGKAQREHAALLRIQDEFPEFPELITIIEHYEAKADEESIFVYAVDKLVDPLGTSLETIGTHWVAKGITYADVRAHVDSKIALNPTLQAYWQMLCQKFEHNHHFYFSQPRD